ncbi:hypothetical protein PENTCL1PPCAC_14258, partial [Pristionchus entomophagus]
YQMPVCKRGIGHHRQSPIDIKTSTVISDPAKCSSIVIRFDHGDCVEVTVDEKGCWRVTARHHSTSMIRASHLPGTYRLLQFHAHWGGSEHTLDGKRFDAEIHFVYWNTHYFIPEEACTKSDGLAVLAILVEKGAANQEFDKLLDLIEESSISEKAVKIPVTFDPMRLVPRSGLSHYFTYLGGLTTPPFSECVVWTVMQTPITFSEEQLKALSTLTDENCRKPQKLHERKVYSTK